VLLYVGFFAGVAAVTWPLIQHPATLWPPHHDARVFTWVMALIGRRLLGHPLTLFHGNAFYPAGQTLAYTELLLPPSLLGLPGFLWGNPVLTYNVLLLTLWPLNGLAMAWIAHALTGSRAAACLAGAVFCLSPYFTEYYLEFQMLLAAVLPVALFAWVRWLETQHPRWLAVALAGLTIQGLTSWYYAIILAVGVIILTVAFVSLRWGGWTWRRNVVALGLGGLCVAMALLPFALPYLAVRREFHYERSLAESAQHYADAASFVEAGSRSRFHRFAPTGHTGETSPFVGFSVLALAATSLIWLRRRPSPRARPRWLGRALLVALAVDLLAAAALAPWLPFRYRFGRLSMHLTPAPFLDVAVGLGVLLLLVRGWTAWCWAEPRRLVEADWVRVLLLVAGVGAVLALGPVIHLAQRELGPGPYLALYHVLLPLHVVRVTARFAVLSVAGLALLAALGFRVLEDRLRPYPGLRRLVLASVFVVLGLEYAVHPAQYERVSAAPRPVDAALRADPADVAVLEWPTNVPGTDADAMFRSLNHGKRLVNGLSGLVPWFVGDLSDLLTRPGTSFPGEDAQIALRRIYPLRYLVVRLGDEAITGEWHPVWRGLRANSPPLLQFVGSFGAEDLYRVHPLPEHGVRLERWVSYEFLHTHPVLSATLRPHAIREDLEQEVEVRLNDRPIERVAVNHEATLTLALPPPLFTARPNVIALGYGYRRPSSALDARYRIGTTGALSPGDFRVVSAGQPHGSAGSIQLNGVELSPARRGYNLVAVDPTGRLLEQTVFDTFYRPEAAGQLAVWVAALPPGTVVAGAVRDEASGRLTEAAVQALGTLGVAGDLRGRFREAHAFVGVKGAAPGSAVERLGPERLEVTVGGVELIAGRRETPLGFELRAFALEPAVRPGAHRPWP
jgi:hypothetical protein